MRVLIGTALATLLACLPVAASAQHAQSGSADTVQRMPAGSALSRQVMQVPDLFIEDDLCPDGTAEDVQVCSVRNRPAAVRALHRLAGCLIISQRTSSERAVWQYMSTGDVAGFRKVLAFGGRCRGAGIQASPVLFGGALAEALLTRAQTDRPPDPRPTTFNCLITHQPEAASRLMRTPPWSAPERAQMAAIVAALPQCVPRDVLLKTSKRLLRAGIALEWFRAAHRLPENLELSPMPKGTVAVTSLSGEAPPVSPAPLVATPAAAASASALPAVTFPQPLPASKPRKKSRMIMLVPEEARRADATEAMVDPNTGEAPGDSPRGRLRSRSDPF